MAELTSRQRLMATLVVGEQRAQREERRWFIIGILVLVMTIGAGATWSMITPLASAVLASGIVKVDSSRKRVQHSEGGVVSSILVKDGDVVREGDVLVRLDATRADAAHGVVTGGRDVALATLARLEAERDLLESIVFPSGLVQRLSADPLLAQIVKAQEAMFRARRSARNGELDIVNQQIASLRNEIVGFESQQRAKEEQAASLEKDLEALRDLDAQGMVERTKLRAVEREVAKVKGERDELKSKVAAAKTAISEKELRKFQVRKSFQEEVANELKKANAETRELQERETATRRTLQLTELRAPASGTVTDLKVHTNGGVISPGEVLMEIVPAADRLVIEARVPPADIDRVSVGLRAGVKLQAFNTRIAPELNARVQYVSADAVLDQRTDTQHFVVKLAVDAGEAERLGDYKIQPGMQADVFIRTGEQTLAEYLVQPLADSFRKAWRER